MPTSKFRSEEDRHAVVSFYKKGWKNCKVSSTLTLKKYEVSRVLKRYKETGSVEDRPRSGKTRHSAHKSYEESNSMSSEAKSGTISRKMAQELNISDRTVRRIVKEDLKLVSYKKITAHVLTDKKRLENCKRIFRSTWNPSTIARTIAYCYQKESARLLDLEHLGEQGVRYKTANVESLKRALQKAWDDLDQKTLATIAKNFKTRLEACIEAEGGHFEHFL
ncbi:hypothetical protein L596_025289 [Steinernema carpocapsae]|uniref:Paired domain-containing protein n=1 Tax=Steinernema carpocapsae TaxID=34508 RepID=A0A4U5M7D2_STECR|nr:hypothetical protein L596_025289 [Steinernema carpocapsae]